MKVQNRNNHHFLYSLIKVNKLKQLNHDDLKKKQEDHQKYEEELMKQKEKDGKSVESLNKLY